MKTINVTHEHKVIGKWTFMKSLDDFVFVPNYGTFLNEREMRKALRVVNLEKSKEMFK